MSEKITNFLVTYISPVRTFGYEYKRDYKSYNTERTLNEVLETIRKYFVELQSLDYALTHQYFIDAGVKEIRGRILGSDPHHLYVGLNKSSKKLTYIGIDEV